MFHCLVSLPTPPLVHYSRLLLKVKRHPPLTYPRSITDIHNPEPSLLSAFWNSGNGNSILFSCTRQKPRTYLWLFLSFSHNNIYSITKCVLLSSQYIKNPTTYISIHCHSLIQATTISHLDYYKSPYCCLYFPLRLFKLFYSEQLRWSY